MPYVLLRLQGKQVVAHVSIGLSWTMLPVDSECRDWPANLRLCRVYEVVSGLGVTNLSDLVAPQADYAGRQRLQRSNTGNWLGTAHFASIAETVM